LKGRAKPAVVHIEGKYGCSKNQEQDASGKKTVKLCEGPQAIVRDPVLKWTWRGDLCDACKSKALAAFNAWVWERTTNEARESVAAGVLERDISDAVKQLADRTPAVIKKAKKPRHPTVKLNPVKCTACGHHHTDEKFGHICVGCPCQESVVQTIEGVTT
jgi:hypothetical protein